MCEFVGFGDGGPDSLDRAWIGALETHGSTAVVLDVGSAVHQFSFSLSSLSR